MLSMSALMELCVCRFVAVWWPLRGVKLWNDEDRLTNPPVAVEKLDSPQKTEGKTINVDQLGPEP